MVNEVSEVRQYLDGQNINEKSIYRICFMLAKWYKQQGLSHIRIRETIFEWGKKYHINIDCNLNRIITRVMNDKHRLRGDETTVRVSKEDVEEIIRRFDNSTVRRTALAVLCYAKVAADSDGEFSISLTALSDWLKISKSTTSTKCFEELCDFSYVEKLERKTLYSWDNKIRSKTLVLKMLVPIENKGEFVLADNDINGLYEKIFKNS